MSKACRKLIFCTELLALLYTPSQTGISFCFIQGRLLTFVRDTKTLISDFFQVAHPLSKLKYFLLRNDVPITKWFGF